MIAGTGTRADADRRTPGVAGAHAGLRCTHCGLPVPPGLVERDAAEQFCCAACRTAYRVIHSCGLTRYYDYVSATGERQAALSSGRGYDDFDDPKFHELYCRAEGGGVESIDLYAEGIHCAACVWLLEKLPFAIDGVLESRVNYRRGTVSVRWSRERVRLSQVARFVDTLGYPVHPVRGAKLAEVRAREDRTQLVRIGVAGAIAGNVMLLAFALYAGAFSGMEAEFRAMFRWISMGLGLVSLAWPGMTFFRGALSALRTRTLHMDVPIALGLAVGGVAGAVNTLRGAGEIYFDTLTVLVFLLLVGRWVQSRQQRRSSDAVEMLYSLTPTSARLVEGDLARDVPIEALQPGDVVEVRAGGSVPVDGEIVGGTTDLDQSLLTGEPLPVRVGPGEKVAAGGTALTAPIRVRVEATGEQTRVGRLMRMVEEAAARRAPIVRMADRIAGVFVGVVLVLAVATLAGWMLVDPEAAVENATALLIVTCPCALGLATPLAIVAAIGRAARREILVKGGDALEVLSERGTIVLDKTGTITEGRMRVATWRGPDGLKPLVGAVEARCAHPVAGAFVRSFGAGERDDVEMTQRVGGGVEARIGDEMLTIGSPVFVARRLGAPPAWAAQEIERVAGRGLTPVLVARGQSVEAVAGVGDAIRPDAAASIAALRDAGWDVRILSGDHPEAVRTVGERVGVGPDACEGGATPERKLEVIESMARAGTVVMVGDGVNDAGALSAATVGIAVHGGADVSMNVADVYVGRPGLRPVRELFEGARRTRTVIRRNLGASLAYNVVCATLAVSGFISPLLAAVLMPASSLTVVLLSYRSRTFEGERCR